MDFVTLTCPTCGGKLKITSDINRFACGHCGNEHIVKREGGLVAIAPVIEGLNDVRIGVDKTASELAINRLRQELRELDYTYALLEQELNDLEALSSFFNKKKKNEIRITLAEIKAEAKDKIADLKRHQEIVKA